MWVLHKNIRERESSNFERSSMFHKITLNTDISQQWTQELCKRAFSQPLSRLLKFFPLKFVTPIYITPELFSHSKNNFHEILILYTIFSYKEYILQCLIIKKRILRENNNFLNMNILSISNREGNGTQLQYSCLKIHRWRSLVGCSPWGRKESDTTERLPFHFSLSRIGEGNGSPLQCSCLENPRDGGYWWAAIYGVAQSRTWLKWLSSSSSISKAITVK